MLKRLLLSVLLLTGLTIHAGCTSQPADQDRTLLGGFGTGEDYYGPETLEETIAWADTIVRAELISVSAVSERKAGESDYIAALDHRFRVLEYLRGSGSPEIVGVVYDSGETFSSSESAIARANILKDRRDTQWDGREAIIFLENDHPSIPSTKQADRYRLGGYPTTLRMRTITR